MKLLKDLAELDAMIAACDAAEATSDDALRALFATFRMEPPAVPADPFSPEYREAQMALYARIAGRPYSTANEVTAFDVDAAVAAPFPFGTRSCTTAGEHFQAMGMLLRQMALKPGSRVLEFGPGWGNTTIALAKLGHRVTAVDIEPHFCELLRRRAQRERVQIEVVNDDFLWAEGAADGSFDAVVFFECFHHCADHLRLLSPCGRWWRRAARCISAPSRSSPTSRCPGGYGSTAPRSGPSGGTAGWSSASATTISATRWRAPAGPAGASGRRPALAVGVGGPAAGRAGPALAGRFARDPH
jgi:protein-L-isoaspartate O-methyltransferase